MSEKKKTHLKGEGRAIPYENDDSPKVLESQAESPEIDDEDDEPNYIQWITRGNKVYYPEAQVKLQKKIPSGYFSIGFDQQQNKFLVRKLSYNTDKVLKLPMPETEQIVNDITTFWTKSADFARYELTFKRGILLYGVPGGGKSHIIALIVKHLIDVEKGVVFKIEEPNDVETFKGFMNTTFKIIEPNRKIVVIIEDIDGLFHSSKSTETTLLNILDGMGQMNNVVYLATTNYPEELADRIINRPSRFDRRYEITLPNDEVRRSFFEQVLKPEDLAKIDLNHWVLETNDLSLAHLREVIVSTIIQGNTFEKTIKMMKDYTNERPSSRKFKGSKTVGFGK